MDYPEKTCTLDRLVRQKKLIDAVLSGRKTEQRRNGVYGYPDECFELEGRTFRITSLTHDRLGDMGEAGATAEGFESLEDYRALILRMHRGMEWEPEHRVWVHRFSEVEAAPS